MPIRFTCPSCSAPFNVPDDKAGKKTKCPKCASMLTVPSASSSPPSPPTPPPPPAKALPPKAPPAQAPVYIPHQPAPQAAVPPAPIIVQMPNFEPERRRVDHTHRARGSFGSAFGATMGCMVAVSVFVILIMCGGGYGIYFFLVRVPEIAKQTRDENNARQQKMSELNSKQTNDPLVDGSKSNSEKSFTLEPTHANKLAFEISDFFQSCGSILTESRNGIRASLRAGDLSLTLRIFVKTYQVIGLDLNRRMLILKLK